MATVGLSRDTAIEAKAPEEAKVTAMMIAAWSVGSVLISKTNFMPKNLEKGEIVSKIAKSVLEKCARVRGRNQGQCRSYGSGISMVLRCGRKPSGEQLSASLGYALGLRTDQTALPYSPGHKHPLKFEHCVNKLPT
jgi:hypothetical protein